jgi:ATP-dependent RNA helicase HelY
VLGSVQGLEGDMPAGDFVRWARQVIDLLDQLAQASGASDGVRTTARQAIGRMTRGVLAYSALA